MVIQPLPASAQTVGPEKASPDVPANPTSKVKQHIQIYLTPFAAPPPGYSSPEPANFFYPGPENLNQSARAVCVPVQQTLFSSNSHTLPEAETTSRCFTTCDCTESILLCISHIFVALCR